jgi:hypothetical protein
VFGEGCGEDAVGVDIGEAADFGAVAFGWFEGEAREEGGERGGTAGPAGGVGCGLLEGGRGSGGRGRGSAASGGGAEDCMGLCQGTGGALAIGKVGVGSVGRSAEGDVNGSGGSAGSSGSGERSWGGGRAGGLAGPGCFTQQLAPGLGQEDLT